jgi:hypothetical protein
MNPIQIQPRKKPSEKFVKHNVFDINEKYHPDLHNSGITIEERAFNHYTPQEIERMKTEIQQAECGICMEKIENSDECLQCSDGHKFHTECLSTYWRLSRKNTFCPLTNSIPKGIIPWKVCDNTNDLHSGGKRSKKYKKSRKSRKLNNSRKSKKTRKSRRGIK